MPVSKSRLFAFVLALAGLGAIALGYAAPHLGSTLLPNIGGQRTPAQAAAEQFPVRMAETRKEGMQVDAPGTRVQSDRVVRVDAPHTAVRVDKDSGKVAVRAPHTNVRVDPDKGQVRVRAPYVNLDIRW